MSPSVSELEANSVSSVSFTVDMSNAGVFAASGTSYYLLATKKDSPWQASTWGQTLTTSDTGTTRTFTSSDPQLYSFEDYDGRENETETISITVKQENSFWVDPTLCDPPLSYGIVAPAPSTWVCSGCSVSVEDPVNSDNPSCIDRRGGKIIYSGKVVNTDGDPGNSSMEILAYGKKTSLSNDGSFVLELGSGSNFQIGSNPFPVLLDAGVFGGSGEIATGNVQVIADCGEADAEDTGNGDGDGDGTGDGSGDADDEDTGSGDADDQSPADLPAGSLVLPGGAVSLPDPLEGSNFVTSGSTLADVVGALVPYTLAFAGIILFLMLVYGGFLMLTSVGNMEQIEKGKKLITSSIIGFIIVFGAFWLMQIVQAIFNLSLGF
jgi:hypothetical protein